MKILCPTDFSSHSSIALEYAMNLANEMGATVHILSVFQVVKSSAALVSMDSVIQKNAEEDMEHLIAGLGPLVMDDNLPVTKIVKGDPVNTIISYAKQLSFDMIVMGTQGDRSISKVLFGSTTKKITEKTDIPVLAIPQGMTEKLTSSKMVLALDNKEVKNENIFRVPKEIAKYFGMKIDILHINTNQEEFPFDPFVSAYLQSDLGEVFIEEGVDPVMAIKQFAERENIAMLIMIRRDKSFFKRLFTSANTAEEIAKTNIPLLILPE